MNRLFKAYLKMIVITFFFAYTVRLYTTHISNIDNITNNPLTLIINIALQVVFCLIISSLELYEIITFLKGLWINIKSVVTFKHQKSVPLNEFIYATHIVIKPKTLVVFRC